MRFSRSGVAAFLSRWPRPGFRRLFLDFGILWDTCVPSFIAMVQSGARAIDPDEYEGL
jgi:hypothetical protein